MELGLEGRVALVTGGSRGIGKVIAYALAREGADVAICARTRGPLESTAQEIASLTGRRVLPVVADVSNTASVDKLVAEAVAGLGGVHILVNNAAIVGGGSGRIERLNPEALLSDFNIKTMGYVRCVRAVAPHFQSQHWGRVVNIGGYWGRRAGSLNGGMRNAAIVNMTKTLAIEMGAYGVTVNAIHPPTHDVRKPDLSELARLDPAAQPSSGGTANNAIRRRIEASDIADVTLFLCSTHGSAVTGQVMDVSGGEGDAVYY